MSASCDLRRLERTLDALRCDVNASAVLEAVACGRVVPTGEAPSESRGVKRRAESVRPELVRRVGQVVRVCRIERASRSTGLEGYDGYNEGGDDLTTDELCGLLRFADRHRLSVYKNLLQFVPRIVNVVTLAEAVPVPGTGTSLPLDLNHIASRCTGTYFAPKRFAAVQLAYTMPRCRVLVFRKPHTLNPRRSFVVILLNCDVCVCVCACLSDTGRVVGTGTCGPLAAQEAMARAQKQLAVEANILINICNFQVCGRGNNAIVIRSFHALAFCPKTQIINQVGAVSLRATLNCEAFAEAHKDESHYDRTSFVGLAWRPRNEQICCEVYSTGRANLPGSKTERDLLNSFSHMLPELLRFSSNASLMKHIPEETQRLHRPTNTYEISPSAGVSKTSVGEHEANEEDYEDEEHGDDEGDEECDTDGGRAWRFPDGRGAGEQLSDDGHEDDGLDDAALEALGL